MSAVAASLRVPARPSNASRLIACFPLWLPRHPITRSPPPCSCGISWHAGARPSVRTPGVSRHHATEPLQGAPRSGGLTAPRNALTAFRNPARGSLAKLASRRLAGHACARATPRVPTSSAARGAYAQSEGGALAPNASARSVPEVRPRTALRSVLLACAVAADRVWWRRFDGPGPTTPADPSNPSDPVSPANPSVRRARPRRRRPRARPPSRPSDSTRRPSATLVPARFPHPIAVTRTPPAGASCAGGVSDGTGHVALAATDASGDAVFQVRSPGGDARGEPGPRADGPSGLGVARRRDHDGRSRRRRALRHRVHPRPRHPARASSSPRTARSCSARSYRPTGARRCGAGRSARTRSAGPSCR